MQDIAAVVVTYNRKELIRQCLNAILSQKGASCDIIVIDNGSSDGTEELINIEFSYENILYINMGENLGCAAGTSRGMKEAVLRNYKYVWNIDDDACPHEDALIELLKADEELNGDWGILSSVAYWIDGNICESNREKINLFRFVRNKDYYSKRFIRVCMVSQVSLFVKAEVIKEVGLPISEYNIYTEDYEFCSRVGRKHPIYVIPASKVTHYMNVNRKANLVDDTPDRMARYKYLYRNDVNCYKKLGFKGHLYLIVKFIYTFLLVLLKEKEEKKTKLNILISGYTEGKSFNPPVEMI